MFSITYSNARIKALENKLLTQDKFQRIIQSGNIDEAVKILLEINYGQGAVIQNPLEYEKLLNAESDFVAKLFKEIMPKGLGLDGILYNIDVHNLKLAMKLKYSKKEFASWMFLEGGEYNPEQLYLDIIEDKYFLFDEAYKEALSSIDLYFAQNTKSAAYIDTLLDKANYSRINRKLKSMDKIVQEYFEAYYDFANFACLLRAKKIGYSEKEFEQLLLDTPDKYSIIKLYDAALDTIAEHYKYKKAGKVFQNAILEFKENSSLLVFERDRDDYLINIFKTKRNDIFSISPMLSFYFMKQTEIKMLRLALTCVKNNIDRSQFTKRLRLSFD